MRDIKSHKPGAQKLASAYLEARPWLRDGQEFQIYSRCHWHTYKVVNVCGYREARKVE